MDDRRPAPSVPAAATVASRSVSITKARERSRAFVHPRHRGASPGDIADGEMKPDEGGVRSRRRITLVAGMVAPPRHCHRRHARVRVLCRRPHPPA